MFGRRQPTAPTPDAPMQVYAEPVLVAMPDVPSRSREAALRYATGRQLQGQSGTVVGHDRGDPSLTFETVVSPVHDPTAGIARVGFKDSMVFDSTVNDDGTGDETMTAYQRAQLARIAR